MTANEALKKLIAFYSPYFKPSGEYQSKFLEAISKFPDVIIQTAYDWTTDNDAKPPAMSSFRAYCYEFQDRAEAERHKLQMENDRKAADQIFRADGYGSEYSKNCFALIRAAMGGQITVRKFLDGCRLLNINVTNNLGPNPGFIGHMDQWGFDYDNIMGAHLMHNFEGTVGKKVKRV